MALSSVIHQGDFFSKLLYFFTYNRKTLSIETQTYGAHYTQFQASLEACLQSKNPVEAALYLEPQLGNLNQEFVALWERFIEDLANCYNPADLEAYEKFSLATRRSILYTQQDE